MSGLRDRQKRFPSWESRHDGGKKKKEREEWLVRERAITGTNAVM